MTEPDPQIYVVNASTSRDTRELRRSLPRDRRTQRVIQVMGVALHPNRQMAFPRSRLLANKAELQKLEEEGVILFRRMNMTAIRMSEDLLPHHASIRGIPELPAEKLIPPPGDIPAESMGPPPEGGFDRKMPNKWDSSSSPQFTDAINKMLADGLLTRRPSSEGIIKRDAEAPSPAPEPAADTKEAADPWEAHKEPKAPEAKPVIPRKMPVVVDTEDDPFAPGDFE